MPIYDTFKTGHPKTYMMLRKRGVERVLRPENVVVFCFSNAKGSAAYNQQATTNIISIVKIGQLPDGSHCEAFLGGKRIEGGVRHGFPPLSSDKLGEWSDMQPLFAQVKR